MCRHKQSAAFKGLLCSVRESHTNQRTQPFVTVSRRRFCANDTFRYFFCISYFNSVYPAFFMLTRFKWVQSVLYVHLFRTAGGKSADGLCAHTEIGLIWNQRAGFLCLAHLWP